MPRSVIAPVQVLPDEDAEIVKLGISRDAAQLEDVLEFPGHARICCHALQAPFYPGFQAFKHTPPSMLSARFGPLSNRDASGTFFFVYAA